MSPEPLNYDTGYAREIIDAKREQSAMQTKEELRAEFRGDVRAMQTSIQGIKEHGAEVDRKLADLQDGQETLRNGQADLIAGQLATNQTVNTILAKVSDLAAQTITIEEETEDGRKIVKHFQNWGTVGSDLKKWWPQIVGGVIAYKAIGGWLIEHGITWSSIWAPHK